MRSTSAYDATNGIFYIRFEIPENEIVDGVADHLLSHVKTAWEIHNEESSRRQSEDSA